MFSKLTGDKEMDRTKTIGGNFSIKTREDSTEFHELSDVTPLAEKIENFNRTEQENHSII